MNGREKTYPEIYQEINIIGRGNFGSTYLVKNLEDNTLCLAKKIPLDALSEEEVEGAFHEANLIKNLHNPHIVSYKNSYKEKRVLIIVTEYCDKGDLATQIKKKKEENSYFSEEQIMHWFVQICLALKYIHENRVLHRDLKASNIFLTKSGYVKLGDFGISKVLPSTLKAAMTVVGPPYYMSPQVCQIQPYTFKSDIWAAGCLLFELCALEHPFTADNLLSLVFKIVKGNQKSIPKQYSQELQNIINAMLVGEDTHRPTSNELLGNPYLLKYVHEFVQTGGKAFQKVIDFEKQATATAKLMDNIPKVSKPIAKKEEKKKKLTARELAALKKEEDHKGQFEALCKAAKQNHSENRAEAKQRKLYEFYNTDLNTKPQIKNSSSFPEPPAPFTAPVVPAHFTPLSGPELTQTTFYLNDRSDIHSLAESISVEAPAHGPAGLDSPSRKTGDEIRSSSTIIDTRIIHSKGLYDIDSELDQDEECYYEDDFEEEEITKREDEMKTVIDSYKGLLLTGREDKAREKSEMQFIEQEQMKSTGTSSTANKRKEECIKILGASIYEKMYSLIKKVLLNQMKYEDMINEVKLLVNNDKKKINVAITIEMIIYEENISQIFHDYHMGNFNKSVEIFYIH